MKVGIISDSHDHIENLKKVLDSLREEQIGLLIHCGDFCAPFVLDELDTLGVGVHGVFGNVDGDIFSMLKRAETTLKNIVLHGNLMELDIEGVRVAAIHYPEIADGLARSGKYDLVCYGHTHIASIEKINDCIFLNPGEVMGRSGKVTYALFDTDTKEVILKEV